MSSKGVQRPHGVKAGRSAIMKLATPEMIEAMKLPPPKGQLDVLPQSFQGSPAPPIKPSEAKLRKEAQENPLLLPGMGPKLSLSKMAVEDGGPSLHEAPIAKVKKLRMVKETPDYRPIERTLPFDNLENIREHMTVREDGSSIPEDYMEKQREIETKNPYLTDTIVYTPQTRRSFRRFVDDTYADDFRLAQELKGDFDKNACAKLESKSGEAVEAFQYQKFIREYIRNASPYRGVLVYHGLGSGKTCSAVAAAEALYGTSNKKIIVMTPFSLRANFMSEISFCGFRHFNYHNHWVRESLISEGGIAYMYAVSVLSLRPAYLARVLKRPDEERISIWIPDFTKPPNYDSDELSQQDREDIREQLTEMIDSRIKFISYNGITAAELKQYACNVDPETGKREFDDAVIIIDEVHNLTRLMQGNIVPYITQRKGRKRKIEVEPIEPGRWNPGLCGKEMNYSRAYLFYRLLTDARNSKIIGLSGTPIINFPEELGILANVLAGYIECVEFTLLSADKETMEKCREIAESEPRIDIVRFRAGDRKMDVLLSTFNEGYEKVTDADKPNDFIGVRYNEAAQEGIRDIFSRIKAKMLAANLPIGSETYVSYPRLPIDGDVFKQEFINPVNLSITNKLVLQKRLTGLISYYRGSKEEYMPRVVRDEIIECDMSDHQLSLYSVARIREIKGEKGKEKEMGDVFSAVEAFAKMKNPSSYRFRSRAICNFAFPKDIERPFPDSKEEEDAEVVADPGVAIAEMEIDAGADLDAIEQVADEEVAAPDEEEAVVEVAPEAAPEAAPEEEQEAAPEEVSQKGGMPKPPVGVLPSTKPAASKPKGILNRLREATLGSDDEDEDSVPILVSAKPAASKPAGKPSVGKPSVGKPPVASKPAAGILNTLKTAALPAAEAVGIAVAEPEVAAAEVVEDVAESAAVREVVSTAISQKKKGKPSVGKLPASAATDAAPVLPAAVEPPKSRPLSYKEMVKRAMDKLDNDRVKYLQLDNMNPSSRLQTYSPKLDKMIRRIEASKGSNLVYSQFKTVEGLGVLGVALKANRYIEIKIEGSDASPYFSEETEASFRKGPAAKEKRFITFTGEGSKDRRALILNLFNGNLSKLPTDMRKVLEESGYNERFNQYGDICWVIGITGAGAEGISLKNCRSVHIMEPYWNNVRLDQVKGRAIRICSHKDLPFDEREVELYTYYTVFSEEQKRGDKIDVTIRDADKDRLTSRLMTSDENVFYVSVRKDKINQELLTIMKESAVDCKLNAADNAGIQCLQINGRPDQYIFDPNLQIDKTITGIEFTEDKQPAVAEKDDVAERIAKELGTSIRTSSDIVNVPVCVFGNVRYLLQPKPGAGGLAFNMYLMQDVDFRNKVGEVGINPATGNFNGAVPKLL
jgi:hypothetical protein